VTPFICFHDVALVSGSTRGLGKEMALALAQAGALTLAISVSMNAIELGNSRKTDVCREKMRAFVDYGDVSQVGDHLFGLLLAVYGESAASRPRDDLPC
jgi:NAD(P)-dependent dehydrogenase (short-subunit alcohol dehydrogenase family)